MSPSTGRSGPWSTIGGAVAAVAACAVCCAGPLLAVLGTLAAAATVAAVWIPALASVAVVAFAGALVVRRRRRAACRTDPGPVDLGVPAPRDPRDSTRPPLR
ncbi:hypothetical protein [Frankia sp. AgKG'84/4]